MTAEAPVLESSKTEVILVGRFTPDDVHPKKLADANIISEFDAKSVTFNGLLQNQLVDFVLGDWAAVQAVGQRLSFVSSQAPYVRIADLALKVVRETMKAPAVTMLGINREFQYRFPTTESRDAFGTRLSPLEAWGDWGKAIKEEFTPGALAVGKHGGLMSIQMREADLDDREAGWIDTSLTSAFVAGSPLGVLIRVNDHYQCSDLKDPQNLSKDGHELSRTGRLLDALLSQFDSSIQRSDNIVSGLMKL
jgi:hypothetical protein